MEFRQLDYFVAVAEELHFRRAAERLHVAQPAISWQIKHLEAELGAVLLRRTTREVALTDAGRAFLVEAREILNRRADALVAVRRAQAGEAGSLALASVSPATYSIAGPLVRTYHERFPDVTVTLHELTTAQQLEGLAQGRFQAGFVRLPLGGDDLEVLRVWAEDVVVILPEHHAFARHDRIRLEELATESFVMVSALREPAVVARYVGLCHSVGFSPRIIQEANEAGTILGFIAAGLGVALGPVSLAIPCPPGVTTRPIEAPKLSAIETGLVWRRQDVSPQLLGFVETVRLVIRQRQPRRRARASGQ